ncbi:MAG: hypothetical protein CL609_11570, partial [Anaerolineaceae bacterium]|nr:hypothetical protein [Anaerolineaceae bacterium]
MTTTIPHLRVARPTNNIQRLLPFYRDALGLSVLGSFEDHQGFDGIMLGFPNSAFHLEFTLQQGELAPPAPTKENLLVFYYPDQQEWQTISNRFLQLGFEPVPSHNPYQGYSQSSNYARMISSKALAGLASNKRLALAKF